MNEELIINADECYRLAEQKAAAYFQTLYEHVIQKAYIPTLTKDIKIWQQNHIHRFRWKPFSRGKHVSNSKDFHHYIQWLNYTGKLDHYLDRSISYLFMRDLGKPLDSSDTKARIRQVADRLKKQLTEDRGETTELFSLAEMYRMAQKEHIESTMIWLINKIKTVSTHIPEGMDPVHAQRKLIKIIAGVLMHVMEEMNGQKITPVERTQKLDEAIRLGYSYGLTYPFIDDILDANIFSDEEKKQYSNLIRTALTTGSVPELGQWNAKNADLIRFIHSELRDAFHYMKEHQSQDTLKSFLEQSYVFFNSQEIDRAKDLSNAHYSNEDLFIPVIIKSSSSRLIVRSIINAQQDEGFSNRTFFYGIYNQLADDFADMFEDMEEGAVTPYTYYLKYHHKRDDLINPFELYWTVISNIIHNVYHSDPKACEVILDRAINGLKRFKERMGKGKYKELMELFFIGNPDFNRIIQKVTDKADDVDFFDKLVRDHIISILKNEKKEQEDFLHMIESIRDEINSKLFITKNENFSLSKDQLTDAANYSLKNEGKRLRPIITWVMGVNEYGLESAKIVPLLRSLEYMHTASLIYDDLPSQDNANTRRGRPTLHQLYNIATAELTALFLTQKAVEEQASLDGFDSKTVIKLIKYSTQVTQVMCKGQEMDLDSKGKQLTVEQLNKLCFYKTGIAFEAALIMPAILAGAMESEMEALKKFARHAGIAFQIKDDLLDVEGNSVLLGKKTGMDAENHNSTFVSVMGREDAKKEMWEHYCCAIEALQEVPRNTAFLKQLVNYLINRDH